MEALSLERMVEVRKIIRELEFDTTSFLITGKNLNCYLNTDTYDEKCTYIIQLEYATKFTVKKVE